MNQDVIQVPFEGVAVRKLHDLFERGYTVCGVAIQRPSLVADADRGAITTHGMVMWWPPEQHKIEQVPAPKNLYEITGNVAHVNTVLIERAELHRLQAENAGVQALIAVHQRTLERCLDLKAECAELEAMLDAVGAGGVGESIRSAAQPDVRIRTSAPDAPQPPAAQQAPVAGARCKIIDNCKSCQHSAGRQSCMLANRAFEGRERPPTPPDWCPLPLYTTPQPTENLRCKSTQKRLAMLWGYVKQEPARQPLTDAELHEALRSCPHDTVEGLRVRWLYAKDFARAIEAAHGITGGQQ